MVSLLLAIIYLSFVSLGLPDSLVGSGWPVMYPELGVPVSFAGLLTSIIAAGTIASSLVSERGDPSLWLPAASPSSASC